MRPNVSRKRVRTLAIWSSPGARRRPLPGAHVPVDVRESAGGGEAKKISTLLDCSFGSMDFSGCWGHHAEARGGGDDAGFEAVAEAPAGEGAGRRRLQRMGQGFWVRRLARKALAAGRGRGRRSGRRGGDADGNGEAAHEELHHAVAGHEGEGQKTTTVVRVRVTARRPEAPDARGRAGRLRRGGGRCLETTTELSTSMPIAT